MVFFRKNSVPRDRFQQWTVWILAAIAFIIPLVFLPNSGDPFELSKLVIFGILITAGFIVWALGALRRREIIVRWSWLWATVLAFFCMVLLSALFSPEYYRSFIGLDRAVGGTVVATFYFILFFFLLVNATSSVKDIRCIFSALLASIGAIAVFTFLQLFNVFIFPWPGTHATAFSPLASSTSTPVIVFAIAGVLLAMRYYVSRQKWVRALALSGVVILCILLALFDKTIGWFALGIGFFVLVLIFSFKSREVPTGWMVLPTLFLVAAVAFMFLPLPGRQGLPNDTVLDQSTGWKIMTSSLTQRALTGLGPQNFTDAFERFRPLSYNASPLWQLRFIRSSNQWFETITTLGVLGFISFITLMVLVVIRGVRFLMAPGSFDEDRMFGAVLCSGWVILVFCAFLIPWNFVLFFFWWVLTAGIIRITSGSKEIKKVSLSGSPRTTVPVLLTVVTGVLGLSLSVFFGVRVWNGDRLRAQAAAKEIHNHEDIVAMRSMLEASVKWNPYSSDPELFLALAYAMEAVSSHDPSSTTARPGTTALVRNALLHLQNAATKGKASVAYDDGGAAVYRQLASLLTDETDGLITLYEQATQRDPNNPLVWEALGETYYAKARDAKDSDRSAPLQKAADAFHEALRLKADYPDPGIGLALVLELDGHADESLSTLIALHTQYPAAAQVSAALASAYARQGKDDEAIDLYVLAIQQAPNSTVPRWELGTLLEKRGDAAGALEQFSELQKLLPDGRQVAAKITDLSNKIKSGKNQ